MNIRERNIKTYTSYEQLGITPSGTLSLVDIIKKMPDYSQLIIQSSGGEQYTELSGLPVEGTIFINRHSINRIYIQYIIATVNTLPRIFIARYRGGDNVDDMTDFIELVSTAQLNSTLSERGLLTQCKFVKGDWNTACGNTTGFYMGNNLTNSPNPSPTNMYKWFYVIHLVHNTTHKKQIAYDFFANTHYERVMVNGTWGAWESK